MKYVEEQSNKKILLTIDNGAKFIARLPSPNTGPSFLVASEVVARQFVRDTHAWCPDPSNAVSASWIIKEKAPGTRLRMVRQNLSRY